MSEEKALVPVEERQVDFYGDDLTAALVGSDDQGRPLVYVPVRPICDFLGVDWSSQRQRILRDPVLADEIQRVVVTTTHRGPQESLCLPLDFLPGWLFGINASRVREELREKVIRYQRECYRVLSDAFQEGRLTESEVLQGDSPAVQAYHLALAVADLARNQALMEARLAGKLDDYGRRLEAIESTLGDPGRHITPDQASQLSQAVKAVAMALGQKTKRNEYGGVYGELYRRFGITSYKLLPRGEFHKAMNWLSDWYQSLTGDVPF